MRQFIAAGFGEPMGKFWIERAKRVATGVRVEIPNGLHSKAVNALVDEVAKSGLHAIFHVAGWLWGNPDGTGVHASRERKPVPEAVYGISAQVLWATRQYGVQGRIVLDVGPELDIDPVFQSDHGQLKELCVAAWEAIQKTDRDVPMVAASVSNLVKGKGMKALGRWMTKCHPAWWAGVHPYRTRGSRGEQPHTFEGFRDADTMLVRLRGVIGERRFAITEAGWHTAEQTYKAGPLRLCTKTSKYSQGEVATFARWDIKFWREVGAELYTWFQLRDGDPNDPHHDAHFGAFEADGAEKLVAGTLEQEKAAA